MRFLLRGLLTLGLVAGFLAFWVVQPTFDTVGGVSPENIEPEFLKRHVHVLTEGASGRPFYKPETLDTVANYLAENFSKAGGRVEFQDFEVEGQRYRNVVVNFGPKEGRPLIVGAHYDTEEHTRGADDNASGVAGLLALAVVLGRHPPDTPVSLVAFSLEEPPHFRTDAMGSRHFAESLKQKGVEPRLVLVLEMIGYFDDRPNSQSYPVPGMAFLYPDQGDFVGVVGDLMSPRLVRQVKVAMAKASSLPVRSINAPTWLPGVDFSDHASFWEQEMPALMITDTAFYRNPHYHRQTDLPETLDYRRMAQVIEGLLSVIRQFDKVSG